jgi:anti-anti-sigma factor
MCRWRAARCAAGRAQDSSSLRPLSGMGTLGPAEEAVAWGCRPAGGFPIAASALWLPRGRRERVELAVPHVGQLHLTIEKSGATSHLRLMGEFDRAAVGRVESALDRIVRSPSTRRIVFDLRRLNFLDAAGLRTILRANERARAGAFELVVARPRGTANRIFTLTRAGQELSMLDEPEVRALAR